MTGLFAFCFTLLWTGAGALKTGFYGHNATDQMICSKTYGKTGICKSAIYDIKHVSCLVVKKKSASEDVAGDDNKILTFRKVSMCGPVSDGSCDDFTTTSSVGFCILHETTIKTASCKSYSPENTDYKTDALSNNKDDVCDIGQHALTICPPTSCFYDGKWMLFNIVCTPTLFKSSVATPRSTITLPYELRPGNVISLHIIGKWSQPSSTVRQNINLNKDNSDCLYHLSVRWGSPKIKLVYNTHIGRSYGREERLNTIPFNDINNYNIDIRILSTQFKTYVDGNLIMTNQMRMNFSGVRRMQFYNFRPFLKVKVGNDRC